MVVVVFVGMVVMFAVAELEGRADCGFSGDLLGEALMAPSSGADCRIS